MNNIGNHISDQAATVKFKQAGTDWPVGTNDVQTALAKIGSWAIKDNGLPAATEAKAGVARIATQTEVTAGTDDTKFITPKKLEFALRNPQATETVLGTTQYANNTEAMNETLVTRSTTPKAVHHILNTRIATEAKSGTAKIASTAAAKAGTLDNVIMTPLKTKQAIAALTTTYGTASETVQGTTRLSTVAEAKAGTLREGVAVSPYALGQLNANEAQKGLIRVANAAQTSGLADDSVAITPKKLGELKATPSAFGIVKLSQTVANVANTALAANAQVLPLSGGVLTGAIYNGSTAAQNKYTTVADIEFFFPIGTTISVPYSTDTERNGRWMVPNGRWLNKNTYPELFSRIGYHYGGDGHTNFALPDYRGLFLRGIDAGRGIDSGRGLNMQDDMLEAHRHGNGMGEAYDWNLFGKSPRRGFYGTNGGIDWDNFIYYTSNGMNDSNMPDLNAPGIVGNETRPKNHAVYYLMRVL